MEEEKNNNLNFISDDYYYNNNNNNVLCFMPSKEQYENFYQEQKKIRELKEKKNFNPYSKNN